MSRGKKVSWAALLALWGILIPLLATGACDDEYRPPAAPAEPTTGLATVVCTDFWDRAGDRIHYDPAMEDGQTARRTRCGTRRPRTEKCPGGMNLAVFTWDPDDDVREEAQAEQCDDPRPEDGVCPADRPQAGREFTYDRGEYVGPDLLAEKCGRTEAEIEAEIESERALRQAQREAGFHCLSAWDGNFNNLEDLVRPQLHDPRSMDTLSTAIAPVNEDGKHAVTMVFTATNVYGATVTLTALGLADNATCAAELLWIE